jgi:peptide/nickel transport system substrate-binding protein
MRCRDAAKPAACADIILSLQETTVSKRALLVLSLAVTASCSDTTTNNAPSGGTVVIATSGNYGSLFPPLVGSTTGRQISELVYDYLTEVSPSLSTLDDKTFARRLAKSWDWSADSLSLAVHLEPAARWHDGKPVTADDITYSFSVYGDTAFSPMASQLANIDSVTSTDSLTAVFWFNKRYPLQFYDATSQMQILPRHVYGRIPNASLRDSVASFTPVGTGRYRVVKISDQWVELAADTANYRGAPKISRLVWRVFGDANQAARALLAGEADIFDALNPAQVRETSTHPEIRVTISPGADYAFMTFNLERPMFATPAMRRALTMAVDRPSMVKNVFDSLALPAIGPALRYFPSTDSTLDQIPYDPQESERILDSLGWKLNAKSGIRSKGGRELRFKAVLPSTSINRVMMATLLQEQLRKVGVAMEPDAMEFQTFNTRLYGRNFDAALASWHLGTSPASIRQLWTSSAENNLGSYANPVFDALIDSAISTSDLSRSNAFYSQAYQTIIDDAPAIWLYELNLVLAVHKRIRTVPYRPDAWWWSLGDWYIPANERIARDMAR